MTLATACAGSWGDWSIRLVLTGVLAPNRRHCGIQGALTRLMLHDHLRSTCTCALSFINVGIALTLGGMRVLARTMGGVGPCQRLNTTHVSQLTGCRNVPCTLLILAPLQKKNNI